MFNVVFRQQRSTLDHLVRLEYIIREGFIYKQHVVSAFFDLESAYDTTWKLYSILKNLIILHDFGLRCRLPLSIAASFD